MSSRPHSILKFIAWLIGAIIAIAVTAVVAFVIAFWAPDRSVESLSARWAPPPSQWLDVRAIRVHLRDEGPRDDPLPIMLLHGTSSSLHTWDGWAAELSKTRRVIRYDLPGFGLTGPSEHHDYQVQSHAATVRAVMDELKISRVILGGNSLGGHIALVTALQTPERVAKLILVDAAGYPLAPQSIPIGFRLSVSPVFQTIARVTLPRSVVEDSVKNVYGDPSRVTPELVDRYYELTLREGNRQALSERLRWVRGDAVTHQIPLVSMPTLILWGEKDRLIPLEAGKRFARDIKGSELVVFDGLGHVPQEEDSARTVQAVQKFIAR
jgi:pimeloyl-ACP methyl ester carboxylesterase